jgi:hypothetical protein
MNCGPRDDLCRKTSALRAEASVGLGIFFASPHVGIFCLAPDGTRLSTAASERGLTADCIMVDKPLRKYKGLYI